jgi:hypothetical protein
MCPLDEETLRNEEDPLLIMADEWIEQLERALKHAASAYAETIGACPFDVHKWTNPKRNECELCENTTDVSCWADYFKSFVGL